MKMRTCLAVLVVELCLASGVLSAADPILGKPIEQWQQALLSSEPMVRRQAAATLANVAPEAARAGLQSDDEVVRYWVALGLAQSGRGRQLEPQLVDKSPSVRGVAAYGVAKAGDLDKAIPVLIALLDDPQPAVATQALTWLDQLGDAVARPHRAKLEALAAADSEYPKRMSLRILGRLKK